MDEYTRKRKERMEEITISCRKKGEIMDFEIESGRGMPVIEGLRIFNELKSRGISNYEDIRKISNILEILARSF